MEKVKKFIVTDTSGDAIRLNDRVLMVGDELSKDQLCKAVLLMKAMRGKGRFKVKPKDAV